MRLHVLGNGCPHPTPQWYGSAFVLEAGHASVMVDCGPGATYKLVRSGLDVRAISQLFLTHHHFDHNADLPTFVLTRWDLSRGNEDPLAVYGPRGTSLTIERLFGEQGAFRDDLVSRLNHPASHHCHLQRGGTLPRPDLTLRVADVGQGEIPSLDALRVTAASVQHVEPWLQSLAYKMETDAGRILFAGDCADCATLRQLAAGVDTLVLASAFVEDGPAALQDVITSAAQAGDIAAEARSRRLILSHVSPAFVTDDVQARALAAAAESFDGEVVLPEEMTAVDLC